MSTKKRVEEEEEEEEEEDSEPVVITKGRKGSIKIVSDSEQQQLQATGQTTAPKLQSTTSTSVVVNQETDLSQPLHIAVLGGAVPLGSPKAQPPQQQPSPKMPAAFAGSPRGQAASPASPKATVIQQHQAATVSPISQASPQAKIIQQQQSPVQNKPAATIVQPQPAPQPVSPAGQIRQNNFQPQPQAQQNQQPSPKPAQAAAAPPSGIISPAAPATPSWSSQVSPSEGGTHPVLKQVPLKQPAPLVMPEQVVLHPAPVYDSAKQKPRTEILTDEAWRHAADDAAGVAKPERPPTRLGKMWPPAADEQQQGAGAVPAVPAQAPESWVHQESVSAVHAIAAAPWARKQVGRIGAQWPPLESAAEQDQVQFERNLRPQWPPAVEESVPSSQVYQKIALSHVHTQVAKQQVYFNSGGAVRTDNGYQEAEPAPVQPQPVAQQQSKPAQPVAPKPSGPPAQQQQPARFGAKQSTQRDQPPPVQQSTPQPPQQQSGKFMPGAQRGPKSVQQQPQPQAPVAAVAPAPAAPVQQQVRFGAAMKHPQKGAVAPPQQQPVAPQSYQNGTSGGAQKAAPSAVKPVQQPVFRPKFVR